MNVTLPTFNRKILLTPLSRTFYISRNGFIASKNWISSVIILLRALSRFHYATIYPASLHLTLWFHTASENAFGEEKKLIPFEKCIKCYKKIMKYKILLKCLLTDFQLYFF